MSQEQAIDSRYTENSLDAVLRASGVSDLACGDALAFNKLVELCYVQLRSMAGTRVRNSGVASISPTELLHDAIIDLNGTDFKLTNKHHFLAIMSLKMRNLLVDHARSNLSNKRGGDRLRITYTEADVDGADMSFELIALDGALTQLDKIEPRSAQIMHLTYFAGMTREAIAKLLDVSLPTVDRELRFGRAFTLEEMRD